MADDREVLREIWEGRIPVCFTIATEDIESESPESIYLMVPRITYFPLVTEKIQKYFSKYVAESNLNEMWLEYDGQPLKWHYPVGVLYDMHHLHVEESLPWRITVHFQDFPEEELFSCSSKEAVESHYIAILKEADSLKHRGQVINSMQKKEHKQIWNGLLHDKFDQFWLINKRLMETSGEDMFKSIPFRIHKTDRPVIQHLFRPFSLEGYQHTLKDLLKESLPSMWTDDDSFTGHVIIQGVSPPMDTPVLWLSEHFSHPDNFLHICVHP